ncbi:hypothetical protein [Pseudofrankia inefficax]|uniref:Band 7 protein n=1 Tax=Pseudofrankia inefficax (strain DSM 45817 / CECT 9037 / DDB 130130 / EuI1c) TaxID=298654 RepID=E3JB71_PSEI1|nr:hypothetical protein [Pseudofrankia inefficax]ADP78601.1 hypothetical protein FraEuI1c_0519 [Pseudofrankia inefficax]
MVYNNYPRGWNGGQTGWQYHPGWNAPASPVSPRYTVPFFGLPAPRLGWRVVYADNRGNFLELPPGEKLDKVIWRNYYFVDNQTYGLNIETESASSANTSRFRLVVAARWCIYSPIEFLRAPLAPVGHCDRITRSILSDITRSIEPGSARLVQDLIDAKRGVGFTIGSGLVVWIDNVIVHPPAGFEELQGELEQGRAQIDVDRLRRLRRNEQRVDDLDYDAAQRETERGVRRDRGAAFLDRADEGAQRGAPVDGFRPRAELVAGDDHLFDPEPAQADPGEADKDAPTRPAWPEPPAADIPSASIPDPPWWDQQPDAGS